VYLLSIAGIEETANRKGGLMYKAELRVTEPKTFAGSPLYENFSVGTEDDPEAEDPETWKASIGARILKRMFHAAGVEATTNIDAMIAAAEGQSVICLVSRHIDDGKNDPQYKGRERNRIGGWYAPGEREIKVDGVAPAARTAAKPALRRAAPAPVVEEEEEEAAPPPPKRRTAPAAAAPVKTITKSEVSAPAAAPAAKAKTVKCDICNEDVEVRAFSAHVAQHEQDEE
jgi:hypothetical protein